MQWEVESRSSDFQGEWEVWFQFPFAVISTACIPTKGLLPLKGYYLQKSANSLGGYRYFHNSAINYRPDPIGKDYRSSFQITVLT